MRPSIGVPFGSGCNAEQNYKGYYVIWLQSGSLSKSPGDDFVLFCRADKVLLGGSWVVISRVISRITILY